MNIFISFQLGEVEVSNLTILVLAFFSSFTFIAVGISSYKLYKSLIRDLYSLYELMPTAMKVNEEKNANTNIVIFETSTSPSWKDMKIFIRRYFFKP